MTNPTGKCLCESITVQGLGEIDHAHACHCHACRGQNAGGAFHGVQYTMGAQINGESLTWYKSSDYGQRGFCAICGAAIAWQLQENPGVTILSLGLFDEPTGAKINAHIFSDQAGDYYTLTTDVPHKTSAQMFAEFPGAGGREDG